MPVPCMTKRSRFPTSTVVGSEYLVPWLAAEGPLAYSPMQPPDRDYFFQYSWVLPEIFNPEVNLRPHRYFGSCLKDRARFLFEFWEAARKGRILQHYYKLGLFSDVEVKAPLAVYHHVKPPGARAGALFIQHGSYQWIPFEDQPHLERGQALLYRGIGDADRFRCLRFEPQDLSPANLNTWRTYLRLQARMLSDSVLSFNTIHDRTRRTETCALRDGTWLADDMAAEAGLDIETPGFTQDLWKAAQQAYSLEPWMAQRKFGPRYVVLKTPLSNIRITTFFAGEAEAKIIDPGLLEIVETVGCEVQAIKPE